MFREVTQPPVYVDSTNSSMVSVSLPEEVSRKSVIDILIEALLPKICLPAADSVLFSM